MRGSVHYLVDLIRRVGPKTRQELWKLAQSEGCNLIPSQTHFKKNVIPIAKRIGYVQQKIVRTDSPSPNAPPSVKFLFQLDEEFLAKQIQKGRFQIPTQSSTPSSSSATSSA
eukprot:GILI01011540.1.p2 GENE.GILI01011540.1~~GILI01011540.1.p2  ORF type:complete len:112 (+),score=27.66 GILI01011540.1:60-395(+)